MADQPSASHTQNGMPSVDVLGQILDNTNYVANSGSGEECVCVCVLKTV